jgi:hypothetical protein
MGTAFSSGENWLAFYITGSFSVFLKIEIIQ